MRNVLDQQELKRVILTSVFIIGISLLGGCRPKLIAGKYCVEAIGEPGECLFYKGGTGRVAPQIIAVGANDHHVVVKQKRNSTVSYYIIDHTKDNSHLDAKDVVLGPFTENEFAAAKERLNVSPELKLSRRSRFSSFSIVGW